MREIKFRVWHTKSKQWAPYLNGLAIRVTDGKLVTAVSDKLLSPVSDEFIYQQYTGLKDKNKKEIYEGDIVKAFLEEWDRGEDLFFAEKTIYGVVKINPSRTGMIIRKVDCEEEDLKPHFLEGKFKKIKTKYDEVIGNIYENPELLKEKL